MRPAVAWRNAAQLCEKIKQRIFASFLCATCNERPPRQWNVADFNCERGSECHATAGRMAQSSELLQSSWLRLS
jgi:hypothetical protein